MERFDTAENIKTCHTSLLIVHGEDDTLIPVDHAIQLNSIAKPKLNMLDIIPNVGHNMLPEDRIVIGCKHLIEKSEGMMNDVVYVNDVSYMDNDIASNCDCSGSMTKVVDTSLEATSAVSVTYCTLL